MPCLLAFFQYGVFVLVILLQGHWTDKIANAH